MSDKPTILEELGRAVAEIETLTPNRSRIDDKTKTQLYCPALLPSSPVRGIPVLVGLITTMTGL